MNIKPNYFFCYSHSLHSFLHFTKGYPYICIAKNYKDDRVFWLYERNEQLNNDLTEYKNMNNK